MGPTPAPAPSEPAAVPAPTAEPPTPSAEPGSAELADRRRPLTLALPKGRLLQAIVPLLAAAGLSAVHHVAAEDQRHLWWDDGETGLRLLLARPRDVWTYVAHGAADLGITGKDVLLEATAGAGFLTDAPDEDLRVPVVTAPPPVVELLDLRAGPCHMAVAGPAAGARHWPQRRQQPGRLRVGTKYPACARLYLGSGPAELELIPLAGSVELAPLVGLAEVIVDLVATGRTLAAHGLVEYERLFESTARLIANEASLRLREPEIAPWVARLEQVVHPAAPPAPAGVAAANGGGDTP